ncbi:carbohydrate kinase [Paenibacillus sp. L3-i20]|uniref:carbohydrate kinase family protein n=1 Tax=Paenibacillus sp. L3-i20 TaxID=2905833 RepID=UPI001EDFD5C3|nr:carbohydrate kinase [Paenibacillus sp. L3-i20]GKU75604.1 fructokinase [Paenibacillus sp. L3-i20]
MEVIALGELLIDFTPHGMSEQGQPLFERNAGGAPANVLTGLARLGRETAFIGAVGNDEFGRYLGETLKETGINVDGLTFSDEAQTTLAFVHLDKDGDRSFTFYRKPGADQMLRTEDVDYSKIAGAKLFHFGSVSMTHEPSRTATLATAAYAKSQGLIVTFDPNVRLPLWNNAEEAKVEIVKGMEIADIVKLSEDELELLTGESDLERGVDLLMERFNIKLLLITCGANGSYCRTSKQFGNVRTSHEGYKVEVVDTTGCGDAFFGGVIHCLLREEAPAAPTWSKDKLDNMLIFANAMGALAATRKGAISSLPTPNEIERFMSGEYVG